MDINSSSSITSSSTTTTTTTTTTTSSSSHSPHADTNVIQREFAAVEPCLQIFKRYFHYYGYVYGLFFLFLCWPICAKALVCCTYTNRCTKQGLRK
ncbi:hypothetical protein PP707_05745 [Acetobacter pasteurianus]|nr:hypothetical protein [Acetobacter pasteurianus]